ncbi:hypothetical protein [Ruixingdingia sedimenti]|uniref:hypothetical protein n=1 Tax=Ruixingdingia sedimenti TaxID=3073604 RepID=UPI00286DE8D7|nr:hypothetical protein [Xinfangfangia sp. LG-4]
MTAHPGARGGSGNTQHPTPPGRVDADQFFPLHVRNPTRIGVPQGGEGGASRSAPHLTRIKVDMAPGCD